MLLTGHSAYICQIVVLYPSHCVCHISFIQLRLICLITLVPLHFSHCIMHLLYCICHITFVTLHLSHNIYHIAIFKLHLSYCIYNITFFTLHSSHHYICLLLFRFKSHIVKISNLDFIRNLSNLTFRNIRKLNSRNLS